VVARREVQTGRCREVFGEEGGHGGSVGVGGVVGRTVQEAP
jgi:hypothetical protein